MSILTFKVLLFVIDCIYSFELLIIAYTSSSFVVNIVSPGQPSLISDDPEAVTLTGSSQEAANRINQKEIHWGVSLLVFLLILKKLPVFLVILFLSIESAFIA